ncbi:MAG: virulence factor SrfC family protein [Gillisia sp.]
MRKFKMRNYSDSEIEVIKDKIKTNIDVLSDAAKWADSHLKYESKHKLLLNLKNNINTFQKVYQNIGSKPVIAIFGGSQVGKSYLIKNLLSQPGKPFNLKHGDVHYDFLKDINPPGVGAESTGVVTRFTISNESVFNEFPIKIKILSPKDIIIILLDSFFLDLKKINHFINRKDLETHIKIFEDNYTKKAQTVLTEFDLLEIKDYFENHLSKHTILFEGLSETRFFERIGKVIDGYEADQWQSIFKVLWNGNEHLNYLFTELIASLKILNYDPVGFISFQAVLRGGGEILDVKRLKELNCPQEKIKIRRENGETVEINISYLTAIIAELIFTIPPDLVNNKEFLEYSDLLDFPGARSRLAIEMEDIDEEIIPDMLLRGKVSYLFNKYSDDFNINNLLFCTNDKQLDVNEIPGLLFNWISKNIGTTSFERTNSLKNSGIPPLFVIFTFFNNQLKYDTTNDFEYESDHNKLNYKWDTRFNRFFQNEIVTITKDWHIDWTKDQPNFKNFYLLRDFKYSTDTFQDFEITENETSINPERVGFLNQLEESFQNFPFVKKHFENPGFSWDNSTKPNKDGSELIISNLNKVSNNVSKIDYYLNKLDHLVESQKKELSVHLYTDDLSVIRGKAMKNVNTLQFSFNSFLLTDPESFDTLIKALAIQPVEVYNLLNENIVVNLSEKEPDQLDHSNILISQFPELATVGSYEEAIDVLKRNIYASSVEEVESFLKQQNISKESLYNQKIEISKAQYFTNLIIDYWSSKITSPSGYTTILNKGLSQNSIEFLSNHFLTIIEKRGLRNKLELILNDIVSETQINRGVEEFLAETFCLLINEFVNNFDLSYLTEEEIAEIENFEISKNFKYFRKKDMKIAERVSVFDEKLFEDLSANSVMMEKYNKWVEFLRISVLVNCGFVNYDEAANNSLKELVNDLQPISISGNE